MEKHPSPKPASRKRIRKSSLTGVVSEPKNVKIDLQSAQLKLHAAASQQVKQKNVKPKIKNEELPKPIPELTKTKHTEVENGDAKAKIVSSQPITQAVESKKRKKMKHINPVLTQPINSAPVPRNPKNKKKRCKGVVPAAKDLSAEKKEEPVATMVDENVRTNLLTKFVNEEMTLQEMKSKFAILNDKQLIDRFTKVPMSNNQKGRIRQAIKLSLEGTPKTMFPEIINGKIEALLKNSVDITDSELRRLRILYNMLKNAIENSGDSDLENKSPKKKMNSKKMNKSNENVSNDNEKKETKHIANKVKGPKRYVVFLGNLPLNVTKEKIMDHFKEFNEHIKDIRLPKIAEGIKSAIAYVELANEPSYELALSKHHSMMGNKRIKVLYTTQQNSKISKTEAKSKSAKLIALQKAGKLIGSIPPTKKRSHRRAIMKQAKAKEAAMTA